MMSDLQIQTFELVHQRTWLVLPLDVTLTAVLNLPFPQKRDIERTLKRKEKRYRWRHN